MNAIASALWAAWAGTHRQSTNRCAPSAGSTYVYRLGSARMHKAASPLQTTPMSTSPFSSGVLGLSLSNTFTSGTHRASVGRTRASVAGVTSLTSMPLAAIAQLTISRLSLTTTIRPRWAGVNTSA